ncbi:MAG TPA: aldehyde dehydrogenase family protein [Oscillospiraceae bacterium]|nr:aldehyde dehydrogenase family protein [Oscillospiraceae bacterium]
MSYVIGEFKNYVNGEWVPPLSGEYREQFTTIDGTAVSKCAYSNKEDLDSAVAAAKAAFSNADWAENPRKRSKALLHWADLMRASIKELATALCWQVGKPYKESFGEMMGAIGYLEYYAASARTLYGRNMSVDDVTLSVLLREPVGVIGVIVPWNYPITLLMRDMAPALAAGNTCVVKPAGQTEGITLKVISLLEQVEEFPAGVVNAVTGPGSVVGDALTRHPDVDMIDFTGSVDVGKTIMRECSSTMKKITLELGGKSASIIFADADLEKALPNVLSSIFSNAGQLCTSASRLLVEETIADDFLAKLKEKIKQMKVGDPFAADTNMGAMNTQQQMVKVLEYIEQGKKDGELLIGGNRLMEDSLEKGCFIEPTVFVNLPQDSSLIQEEIFGPVLCVNTFKTEDEAVEMANATNFGLASGVWTQDVNKAIRVGKKMRAGTCWVNCYNRLFNECETGGYKQSGLSRAGGVEGIEKFTEIKHLCFDYNEKY